jgi:uncharacterized repeat protein (TIGR01451 family)
VGSGAEQGGGGASYRHKEKKKAQKKARAKLVASTSGPGVPVLPGETYSWPFAVTNKGPARAGNVTFVAPLPKTLEFVSGQQNCSWQGTMAVCHLGALKRGQTKAGTITAKVAAKVPAGQTIANRAQLSWYNAPRTKKARVVFPEVRVAETTDISVTKAGPKKVRPGVPIRYEVTVHNNGTAPAKLVVLRDSAAIGVHSAGACNSVRREQSETDSAAAPRCNRGLAPKAGPPVKLVKGAAACRPGGVGGGLVCSLGTLAPGTKKSLTFNVKPKIKPGESVNAPSQVSTATIETTTANNSAVVRTKAIAPYAAKAQTRVRGKKAPSNVPSKAPSREMVEVPRQGAPGKGMVELPDTGIPAKPFVDLALGLIGLGLILYRVGRPRRTLD